MEHTGGQPIGSAKLSGHCSFFLGILPAKVWKLLSHIHMMIRFRDSFLWKTFLFLTAKNAGWRWSRSHTSVTEHVTHRVTHTCFHPLSFVPFVSLTLRLALCSALSQPPRVESKETERGKKTVNHVGSNPSLCLACLSPSLSPPPSLLSSVGCPDPVKEVCLQYPVR